MSVGLGELEVQRAEERWKTEHRHSAVHHFHHRLHHAPLLLARHRLVLAERSQEDQPLDTGLDEHLRVRRRPVEIDGAVLVQLRGDGGKNTGPIRFHVSSSVQ